jgi:23S rRNA pseudouridine1911/1915/1917 synthase
LEERILFEDNHLIVVVKKAGELVQGDITGDPPLVTLVKFFLKKKYNKPDAVFLGVVHRLDRPTSGVVLFAKTSKALSRLNEQFKNRVPKKTYWALVPHLFNQQGLNHYDNDRTIWLCEYRLHFPSNTSFWHRILRVNNIL